MRNKLIYTYKDKDCEITDTFENITKRLGIIPQALWNRKVKGKCKLIKHPIWYVLYDAEGNEMLREKTIYDAEFSSGYCFTTIQTHAKSGKPMVDGNYWRVV